MFFIVSKILLFLLVPFWWLVILFIWRKTGRSPVVRKRLLFVMITILIVFTNPFLYGFVTDAWQPAQASLPAGKNFEAGILLGGMAGFDKFNKGHFGGSADRFIQTANLYHEGIIKKIIVTGGTGSLNQDEPPESVFLRTQFMANGIADSAIIIESRSRNTFENAVYTKRLIDSLHLTAPFLLITSAQHMKRAAQVFKKNGYQFTAFPCDYKMTSSKSFLDNYIMPNPGLLFEWGSLLKEIVGLYIYKLTGKA